MGNCCGEERGQETGGAQPEATKMKGTTKVTNIADFGTVVSSFFELTKDQEEAISKHGLLALTPESRTNAMQTSSGLAKYEGQHEGDRKSGVGHLLRADGDFVVCTFKDDAACGQGAIYSKTGEYYRGQIANSQAHGAGVLLQRDGRRYEGAFENGEKKGHGVFTWVDGSKYEGQWDKKQHGRGKYTNAQGQSVEGEFFDGKKLK